MPLGAAAKTYIRALPVYLQHAAEAFLKLHPMDTTPLSDLVEHTDKLYVGMSSQAVYGMGGMRAGAGKSAPGDMQRETEVQHVQLQQPPYAVLLSDAAAPQEGEARGTGAASPLRGGGKQCSHCGKYGHTQENCWTLHPDLRRARGPQRVPQGRQRPWGRRGAAYRPPATLVVQDLKLDNERLQRELHEVRQAIAAMAADARAPGEKRVTFSECAMVSAELPLSYRVKPPVFARQLKGDRAGARGSATSSGNAGPAGGGGGRA